jgi:hypothetical protein
VTLARIVEAEGVTAEPAGDDFHEGVVGVTDGFEREVTVGGDPTDGDRLVGGDTEHEIVTGGGADVFVATDEADGPRRKPSSHDSPPRRGRHRRSGRRGGPAFQLPRPT